MCEGRNLSTSWALAEGVTGGDDVQAVMGQAEKLETYRYEPGFLTARCQVVSVSSACGEDSITPQGPSFGARLTTPSGRRGLRVAEQGYLAPLDHGVS